MTKPRIYCYECLQESHELSKRSRCVHCEFKRCVKNEIENEKLRTTLKLAFDALDKLEQNYGNLYSLDSTAEDLDATLNLIRDVL